MSWASRRRFVYVFGVFLFFAVTIGIPTYLHFQVPSNCFDGKRNGDETDVDKGGSCRRIDPRALVPLSVQWSRSFPTRDGLYNAVALVQNPNDGAGAIDVPYRFKFYDADNALIAVREGTTTVMPGSIIPVFEGRIPTRNHEITRSFFEIAAPPQYARMKDVSRLIVVSDKASVDTDTAPRVTARVTNTSVKPMIQVGFVAVIFDTAGNAFAASQTALERIDPKEVREVSFTWPLAWKYAIGRIDILPLVMPVAEQ